MVARRTASSSRASASFSVSTSKGKLRVEGLEDTPIDGEGDDWVCTPFPQNSECERFGQKFCTFSLHFFRNQK
jgi:hypothetical protein